MLSPSIRKYMTNHDIAFKTISHPTAYTASQCAQAAHIKGGNFAKTVVVKLDGTLVLVAIPANIRLNLELLKKESHSKKAEIAQEFEFKDKFSQCEVGAIPPFGELFGMEVYLADSLAHKEWFVFSAGTHNELLKIKSGDFLKLVHPKTLPEC